MAFTKSVATANSTDLRYGRVDDRLQMNSMAGCTKSAIVKRKNRVAVMMMQFLLAGIVATGLFVSIPGAVAHGGSGHGGGSWGGHGGGSWGGRGGGWGGHGHGFWAHGHGFHRDGRFFGPGFGFYGYGYPWWWDWYYPGYPYYPYPYYGDPYYGDAYYGNPYYGDAYYGNPYYENRDARSSATKAVQAALARRGYYRGSIDGAMGPETRNAIRSFQAHQGLPVTGQMDGRLIRALQS